MYKDTYNNMKSDIYESMVYYLMELDDNVKYPNIRNKLIKYYVSKLSDDKKI